MKFHTYLRLQLSVLIVLVGTHGIVWSLPPVTTDLVLQLSAEDVNTQVHGSFTVVNQANDQSGNGNDAVQTDPNSMPKLSTDPFSSAPVLRFDGNDQLLIGDAGSPPSDALNPHSGGFTVMVAALQRPQTSVAQYFVRKGNQFSADEGWSIWQQNGKLNGRVNADGINADAHKGGQRLDFELNEMFIFFLVLDPNFVDGEAKGLVYYQGSNADAEGLHGNGQYIGSIDNGEPVTVCQGLDGDIAEILIYNRQLTPTELEDVGIYLAGKYYVGTGTNYPVETCGQLWGNGDGEPEDFDRNCEVNSMDLVLLASDKWLFNYDPTQ